MVEDDEQPMPMAALLVAPIIVGLMVIDLFAPLMLQIFFLIGLFGFLMPITFLASIRQ